MATVSYFLSLEFINFNMSLLAEYLGVNRGTLRKYRFDVKGETHRIINVNGVDVFMNIPCTSRKDPTGTRADAKTQKAIRTRLQ